MSSYLIFSNFKSENRLDPTDIADTLPASFRSNVVSPKNHVLALNRSMPRAFEAMSGWRVSTSLRRLFPTLDGFGSSISGSSCSCSSNIGAWGHVPSRRQSATRCSSPVLGGALYRPVIHLSLSFSF